MTFIEIQRKLGCNLALASRIEDMIRDDKSGRVSIVAGDMSLTRKSDGSFWVSNIHGESAQTSEESISNMMREFLHENL
jgi:hypothetical protein